MTDDDRAALHRDLEIARLRFSVDILLDVARNQTDVLREVLRTMREVRKMQAMVLELMLEDEDGEVDESCENPH